MRALRLLSVTCLLGAAMFAGEASAQISYTGEGGCNKGMFWPFVRSPGDCLTDAERASGMTGTHRGSEIVEEESADEAPPAAPQQTIAPNPAPPAAQAPSAPPTVQAQTAPTPPASPQAPATAAADVAPPEDDRTEYLGEGGCTKGLFWPFVRSPGDCLTDAERASGMTGTHRGSEAAETVETAPAVETPQPAPRVPPPPAPQAQAPAVEPPPAPQPVSGTEAEAEIVPAAGGRAEYLGEGGCTKGIFWPFVRRSGDCLTDAELRSGRTGTYQE